MRNFSLLCFLFLIISCDYRRNVQTMNIDSVKVSEEDRALIRQSAMMQVSGCYLNVSNRDTLLAELIQSGDSVKGKIHFDNFEMDGSSGNIRGKLDGQIIRLWYDFHSEGMNSVMQLIFKKAGDSIIRATGTMDTKGDTTYFLTNQELDFTDGRVLHKTDCSVFKQAADDTTTITIR